MKHFGTVDICPVESCITERSRLFSFWGAIKINFGAAETVFPETAPILL